MHAILLKNSDPLTLISPLRFPKIEQIASRVLFWEIIVTSMLGLNLINTFFFSEETSYSYAQAVTANEEAGSVVGQLIEGLKSSNLNPVPLQKITRDLFSVGGIIVALGGDNIQVFEYPNQFAAAEEASLIAERYSKSRRSSRQGKEIYLFTKDTLVVFYMGNNKEIITALNKNVGPSIVMFPTP